MRVDFVGATIELQPDVVEVCTTFARAACTVHYAKRDGQHDADKRVQDTLVGKLAEYAVAQYLGTNPPDTEIYTAKQKSWAPDLMHGETPISVKTTTYHIPSAVYQRWDKCLYNSATLHYLCVSDPEHPEHVSIEWVLDSEAVLTYQSEMHLRHLRDTKFAVEYSTLERIAK